MSSSSVLLKIALLGDGAVGKTSLRKQYMGQGFHTSHNMTIGADFANLKKEYPATTINYQVWDLAGQQRFQSMRSRFYNGMQGGLCVFDINRLDSFKSLNGWIEELWRHNGKGVVPITILGNKSDLRGKNSISVKDIEKYVNSLDEKAKEYNFSVKFLETSAKTGLNVDEAFETLGRQIMKRSFNVEI